MNGRAGRIGVSKLLDPRWIDPIRIEWMDESGRRRQWEAVERKTRGVSGVDAVAIFPRLLSPGQPPRTVIVKQYRPPLNAYTLENPAGLVDATETVEQAALRELQEETGYVGKVTRVTRPIYNDPGLSSANFCYAFVDCDMQDPRNMNPKHAQEDGENIEILVLPIASMIDEMEKLADRDGLLIDAKCYSLALGMGSKI